MSISRRPEEFTEMLAATVAYRLDPISIMTGRVMDDRLVGDDGKDQACRWNGNARLTGTDGNSVMIGAEGAGTRVLHAALCGHMQVLRLGPSQNKLSVPFVGSAVTAFL